MRTQRVRSGPPRSGPVVIDERKHDQGVPIPQGVDMPVRAVLFVEVGDAPAANVRLLVSEIERTYQQKAGGQHYLIPIRHGRVTADVLFEQEIVDLVDKLCEVVDGKIVLREGAREVHVVRQAI